MRTSIRTFSLLLAAACGLLLAGALIAFGAEPARAGSGALTALFDATPPVTICDYDGTWRNASVTLKFSATDLGSGVAYTDYSSDNGVTWTRGTSVVVSAAGVIPILYRSADNAGNVETPAGSVSVKMLGVALYAGSNTTMSGSGKVASPLIGGQPSAAVYVNGKLTTSSSVDLSKTVQYVKAKGAVVPPLTQFMPDARIAQLTQASQSAQKTGTVYNGLTLSGTKNVTYAAPITVNGSLTISGSGTYTFDSVYVTGNVTISTTSGKVSFASLHVGGSLTVSGGSAMQWGPTNVAGNTTLSGSGQWNVGLLVIGGNFTLSGSQTMAGERVGVVARPVTILLTGQSKAMTFSSTGTYYGLLCNRCGGFTQSGSGRITGAVLCGGSYIASGSSVITYDPEVARLTLDVTVPTVTIASPANGSTVNTASPVLQFTTSDDPGGGGLDSARTQVTLDGKSIPATPGSTLPTLTDGPHTLVVSASDVAGNSGSATSSFTVATAPPASGFTVMPSDPHEGDVVGLYADGWDTATDAQTWKWTVAKGQVTPDTYEGPEGFIVPDSVGAWSVTLTVTDRVSGAASSTQKTISVLPQPARFHALNVEALAGKPASLFARFLDPGWTDTHTAAWTVDRTAVSGSVAEDNVGAMDTGYASATTSPLALGPHTGSLTVNDPDPGVTSPTQSFTITAVADDPTRDEGTSGNNTFGSATELLSEQAHLSYIQSANDVDIFEVKTPDGTPDGALLPYGTEVLVTLRDLPADYDLAVIQDLGESAAADMQKAAFEGSSFASSSHIHSPWEDASHIHSPWEDASHIHSPYLSLPFADASHIHSPFADLSHIHSPFGDISHIHSPLDDTSHIHSPIEDASHIHSPFVDSSHIHSPFLYGVYVHAAPTTDNGLDGYPLSEMAYTGLSNNKSSGSDITFEELGFNNEQMAGKRIAGFSAAPGTVTEVVLATTDFVGGHTYIAVKGANAAFSNRPYTLQVETSQPIDIFSLLNNGQQLPPLVPNGSALSEPVPANEPLTLFVTQKDRIDAIYGADAWSTLLPHLQAACASPLVLGEVVSVPASIYDAWDKEPWRPDLANQVADEIRGVIRQYLTADPSIKYVVLVGSDKVVPQRRVQDQTVLGNERAYANTAFLKTDSPLFASMYDSMVLTDDFYVDSQPIPFNGRSLYIPDIAVSRLVETPGEIAGTIDAFLGQSKNPPVLDRPAGQLDGATYIVTGQDFMADGTTKVQSILGAAGLNPPSTGNLIGPDWTADQLRAGLLGAATDVGSVNAHFTHFGGISALGYGQMSSGAPWSVNELLTGTNIAGAANFNGKLVFSMGCHAGLNVPDDQSLALDLEYGIDPKLDIPQAIARRGGVLVASTGYGFGDTVTIAGTEALIGLFADQITQVDASAGGAGQSIGLALAAAKRQYLGSLSTVTPYDEKSSIQFTMYGMPQYRLPSTATQPAAPAGGVQAAAAQAPAKAVAEVSAKQAGALPTGTLPAAVRLTVIDGSTTHTYTRTLTEVTTRAVGTYFTAGGDAQATTDRPVQPRIVVDLPAAGGNPVKAAFITGGTYVDVPQFDPAISRWTTEWEVAPQEFQVATSGWWPADPTSVSTIATTGGAEQRLVVLPGQFLSTSAAGAPITGTERIWTNLKATSAAGAPITGTERIWTNLKVELIRPAPPGDTIAPTVRGVTLCKSGDTVLASVDATDTASGISRIDVTQVGAGATRHVSFPVAPGDSGPYDVHFDLPGVSAADVSVIVQVMDGAGNVTKASAKGAGVPAVADTTPPEIQDISLLPTQFSTELGPETLTLIAILSDNHAGVASEGDLGSVGVGTCAWLSPPSGAPLTPIWLTRVSGDDHIGRYSGTIVLPQGSEEGIWNLIEFDLVDKLGNAVDLSQADLLAKFWPGCASVTNAAGTMTLNGGEAQTYASVVSLQSQVGGASQMRTSTDHASWTEWRSYAASSIVALPGLPGDKTVWAQYRNGVGNELELSATVSRRNGSMAGGGVHSLTLKDDGSLWAWGANAFGQLGSGTTTDQHSPVRIGSDSHWAVVAAGLAHSLALRTDGSLWAWGYNEAGQLGDGTTTDRHSPVQIGSGSDWAMISSGYRHSLALKSNGSLWAWGWNEYGQVGDGTATDRHSPVSIGVDTDWLAISAGQNCNLALKSDGTVWAWGWDGSSDGNGVPGVRNAPARIGNGSDWAAIAAGGGHNLALKADGSLYAWGLNESGQLGDGTTTWSETPVCIGPDKDWVGIAAGVTSSHALKADGSLYAWGANYRGILGNGTTSDELSPVRIGSDDAWATIAAGGAWGDTYWPAHTLGLKADGSLSAWGFNDQGQLGDDTTTDSYVPKVVFDLSDNTPPAGTMTLNKGVPDWTYGSTVALDSQVTGAVSMRTSTDGTHWTGWRPYADSSLVALTGLPGVKTVSVEYRDAAYNILPRSASVTHWPLTAIAGDYRTFGLYYHGPLYSWGDNYTGQLGWGSHDSTAHPTPSEIGTGENWASVSNNAWHTLALKQDGSLYAWGQNQYGQLGLDVTTPTIADAPLRVGLDTDWVAVSTGHWYSIGLKSDGSMYAWGSNEYGQLGAGTTDTLEHPTPTRVGLDNDWVAVCASSDHIIALKSNGSLWAWGFNSVGQLGVGDTGQYMSPTRIGTDTDWVAVSTFSAHTLALKADGSLWSWGYNDNGQLGLGSVDSDPHPTPTRVGAESDWSAIAAGFGFSLAVKNDGSLWAWGYNGYGQLGIGSAGMGQHPNPLRVGMDLGWFTVSAGAGHSVAIRTLNGQVYTWGRNNRGQLGNGGTTDRASPTLNRELGPS